VTRTSALRALLLAALALAGCSSPPKTNFYTLSPATSAPARADARVPYSVAIGPVGIPESLDRPQMVVRTGANQVTIAEFERWAGPLKNEIALAIAENLKPLLEGASVFTYPQGANADVNVSVDVQRFETVLGEAATVEVLWQVRTAKGAPRSGRSVVREAANGADYDAAVAAHGRALAAVSREIAAAVRAGKTP
jgi:uncharacterized lipoprotein YmbA